MAEALPYLVINLVSELFSVLSTKILDYVSFNLRSKEMFSLTVHLHAGLNSELPEVGRGNERPEVLFSRGVGSPLVELAGVEAILVRRWVGKQSVFRDDIAVGIKCIEI
jgi:hypothetical protein